MKKYCKVCDEVTERYNLSPDRGAVGVCKPCGKRRGAQYRLDALEVLGGRCVSCGYNEDVRALQIDHVHGDGAEERKVIAPYALYMMITSGEADLSRYQVLCANCNVIKMRN